MGITTDKQIAADYREEMRGEVRDRIIDNYEATVVLCADLMQVLLEGIDAERRDYTTRSDFAFSVMQRLKHVWEWSEGDLQLLETFAKAIDWKEEG